MYKLLFLALLIQVATSAYIRRDLVANRQGLPPQNSSSVQASIFDANLVNPWGLAFGPATPAWVANNGGSNLAIISGNGVVQRTIAVGNDHPTGLVYNLFTSDFLIFSSNATSPSAAAAANANATSAQFITVTEEGNVWAWSSSLPNASSAVRVASNASSVFKALAIGGNGTAHFLYAADFANREIVVFDTNFRRVNASGGNRTFFDPQIPSTFSPFGVANILGDIFVAYARQAASSPGEEVAGDGLGFVSVFDANGVFIRRFASQGALNAPWGMTLAPQSFGEFGGSLLIGNFGNGRVWAYDFLTGSSLGQLNATNGQELIMEGLWGLAFGNGVLQQPTSTLFFAAGINDENDGLFGRVEAQR